MKIAIVVLTVLGFGWNHMLLGAQTATIDVAAADGVFLANTIAGGVGSLANAKSGTPDTNSSPRLKLVVVKTLPYPVINSKTPGAEDIPGGFEGGNTVKVTVRGKSEYHLFAHSYETLDWSHCRLDHWVSSDGLQWRHDQVLVPPYTDKATGLWTLSCSPMPFFDTEADRWQIYYALFAKPQQSWSPGGTLRCASSKVKGRDGISGPYDFPGEEVLKPGVGYPKTASVSSVSTPFLAKDGKWLVFYGGDNGSSLQPETKTWGKWWVAMASAPSPHGPYTQLGNESQPLIDPTGFNENPMPIRFRGPKSGKDYWVATFDFLHDEVAGPNLSEIGFSWSSDGRNWPAEHGQAVDIRAGFNAGEKPWWHVIRTPHDLIDEGDGTFTCFFTGTSEDDHGFRGIGMVKFKIEEVTDGSPK